MADSDSLILFIDNTRALYDSMRSIERALMEKIVGGNYDGIKARKAFAYLTEDAAKKYVREFGESEELPRSWNLAFPKKVRDEANKYLVDRFWQRVQVDPHYVQELAGLRTKKTNLRGMKSSAALWAPSDRRLRTKKTSLKGMSKEQILSAAHWHQWSPLRDLAQKHVAALGRPPRRVKH